MTNRDSNGETQEHANKEHRTAGWSKEESRHLFEITLCFAFLFFDLRDFWPAHHFWSICAAVVFIDAFLLIEIPLRVGAFAAVVVLIAGMIAYKIAGPTPPTPLPAPIVGWLQPADEPTPKNACDAIPNNMRPSISDLVILGDTVFAPTRLFAWPVITLGSCQLLTLRKDGNELHVNADIYSSTGELLGRIQNGGYSVSGGQDLIVERSGDLSTLVIHDKQGRELLYVRYVNQNAIRVRGEFSCPSPTLRTVTVTNGSIATPSGQQLSGGCMAGASLSGIKIQ